MPVYRPYVCKTHRLKPYVAWQHKVFKSVFEFLNALCRPLSYPCAVKDTDSRLFQRPITPACPHQVQMLAHCACVIGYRHIIVIYNHNNRQLALSRVVQGFIRHPAGKSPVPYHRHNGAFLPF